MGTRDPRFDAYIKKAPAFAKPILTRMRKAVHAGCPEAQETIKWGHAAFDYHGLFVMMATFKAHCTFGFWKYKLLVQQGMVFPDKTAHGQFGRIRTVADLPSDAAMAKLVRAAAKLQAAGTPAVREKKVPKPPARTPASLMAALRSDRQASAHYQAFTPGKKRDYVEWITEAKTDATRERRIATAVQWIAEGKARNWKYETKKPK